MRIFIKESDKIKGKPLYQAIIEELLVRGIKGATALKAILGYGTTGTLHYEGIETMSYDLPLVIEFVDDEEKALSVLEELRELAGMGLITLERVETC